MTAQPERPLGAVWSPEGACGFLLWAPKADRLTFTLFTLGIG